MYLLHIFLRPENFFEMDVMESFLEGERLLQDYIFTYKNFTVESFVKEARFRFRNLVLEKENSSFRQFYFHLFSGRLILTSILF